MISLVITLCLQGSWAFEAPWENEKRPGIWKPFGLVKHDENPRHHLVPPGLPGTGEETRHGQAQMMTIPITLCLQGPLGQ
jgi:hypothetical protein